MNFTENVFTDQFRKQIKQNNIGQIPAQLFPGVIYTS